MVVWWCLGVDVPLACLLLRLLVYGFMDKNILFLQQVPHRILFFCMRGGHFILRVRDKLGCKIIALRFASCQAMARMMATKSCDDAKRLAGMACQVLLIQKQVVFYLQCVNNGVH